MGYRLGTSEELAESRKARLAARYGTPTPAVEWVESSETIQSAGAFSVAWVDDEEAETAETLKEPTPVGLPVGAAQAPYIDQPAPACIGEVGFYNDAVEILPAKKKGGRPKGSKNKRSE